MARPEYKVLGTLPQGWGPGPWADDFGEASFIELAYQCGDLRLATELEEGHRPITSGSKGDGHGGEYPAKYLR